MDAEFQDIAGWLEGGSRSKKGNFVRFLLGRFADKYPNRRISPDDSDTGLVQYHPQYNPPFDPSKISPKNRSEFLEMMLLASEGLKPNKPFDPVAEQVEARKEGRPIPYVKQQPKWIQEKLEKEKEKSKENHIITRTPKLDKIMDDYLNGTNEVYGAKKLNKKKIALWEETSKNYIKEFGEEMKSLYNLTNSQISDFWVKWAEEKVKEKEKEKETKVNKADKNIGKINQPEPKKEAKEKSKEEPVKNWRSYFGYEDERSKPVGSRTLNQMTHIPDEYSAVKGFEWLRDKYGSLYLTAIQKAKDIANGKEKPIQELSPKEYKEYTRLPFEDAKQMRQFFIDLSYADSALYHLLHFNATKKRAESTISAIRDFKKWVNA